MRIPRIHSPAASVLTAALLAGGLLTTSGPLRAQAPEGPDTTSSTTNDSTGIVTGVRPLETITVNDRRGPFTYRLGPDLRITGPDNRPRRITQIHPGDEATVFYYIRDGWQTVARIVVLHEGRPAGK